MLKLKNTTLLQNDASLFSGLRCNALASLAHFVTHTTKVADCTQLLLMHEGHEGSPDLSFLAFVAAQANSPGPGLAGMWPAGPPVGKKACMGGEGWVVCNSQLRQQATAGVSHPVHG